MVVARSPHGVCAVSFVDHPGLPAGATDPGSLGAARRTRPVAAAAYEHLRSLRPRCAIDPTPTPDGLADVVRVVHAVVDGRPLDTAPLLPLDPSGTAFQRRVWDTLATIPRGETRTYGELAAALGLPGGARAVGRACGANPLALLVPCHRVIAGDGSLGGYRWGLDRKAALLRVETVPSP